MESLSKGPFFHRIVLAILKGNGDIANLFFDEFLKCI